MGAVWSALLVGGGLAGALLLWLLRGPGAPGGDGVSPKDAPSGEAAAPGGPAGHLQGLNGHLTSKKKGPGDSWEAPRLQNPSGADWGNARQGVLNSGFRACSEVSGNRSLESHVGEQRVPEGPETSANAAPHVTEKLPSDSLLTDRPKDVRLVQLDSQDSADHEDWEVVSRHSSWGDVGLDGSLAASGLSLSQGMDCGRRESSALVGTGGLGADGKAVSPEPQQVSIRFQVHYATSTSAQVIAVTGDSETLGRWRAFIPLRCGKDGLWSHSVFLPADTVVQWKFVLVENGVVTRWEECDNRRLQTGHENQVAHGWWGIH